MLQWKGQEPIAKFRRDYDPFKSNDFSGSWNVSPGDE